MSSVQVMCARRERGEMPPVNGAIVRKCGRCDHDVWLGQSSLALEQAGLELVLACEVCMAPKAAAGDVTFAVTAAALIEIDKHERGRRFS